MELTELWDIVKHIVEYPLFTVKQTPITLSSLLIFDGKERIYDEMERQGIILRSQTLAGVLEEVPEAYKDVAVVVDVVHGAGIAKKVARLRPIGVIKG